MIDSNSVSNDWFEEWQLQIEEAVALRSILDTDFDFCASSTQPAELDDLYDIATSSTCREAPQESYTFEIVSRPALPEEGLLLQVGSSTEDVARISHLPPIRLHLQLPHTYPTGSSPEMSITASWLTASQIDIVIQALKELADASVGLQTCYSIVDWLEANLLSHLNIKHVFQIPAEEDHPSEHKGDKESRTASDSCTILSEQPCLPLEVPFKLLRYNAMRKHQLFQTGLWRCEICFEEVIGQNCIYAAGCSHFFCVTCLQTHCSTQLKEGRLDMLICPQSGCKEPLLRSRLARHLSFDDVSRWEELELQATLLHMSDIVFCPRCSSACIEDDDHTTLCPGCHFAFCSLCQSAYHSGQKCVSVEVKLQILKERMAGRNDAKLIQELKRKEQDLLSLASIEKESKPCPVCSVPITKTEGCNKMTCTVCGAFFCWLCNKRVDGYEHFREGGCMLFNEQEILLWNMQQEPLNRGFNEGDQGGVRRVIDRGRSCSQCGQWNSKRGNLNSLTCWACTCRYCYLCGKTLRKGEGGIHYRPTGCKQHSPD